MEEPTISLSPDGDLVVYLPSPIAEGGHHITMPIRGETGRILYRLLSARARAKPGPALGQTASPTQANVEAWLRQMNQAPVRRTGLQLKVEL